MSAGLETDNSRGSELHCIWQFVAMLIGSGASVFVSVGAYLLFSSFYEIPSSQFPVPTAEIWLDMAKLVYPFYLVMKKRYFTVC